MTQQLDIRGSGHSHAIYLGKTRISRFYQHNMGAIAAIRRVEARLKPVNRIPCLGCRDPFNSTGRGHRMCDRCRKEA